ncbi:MULTISPECIES: hypothetical protein [unclassified Gilliamella]|uniref:hypothetical protein n=1 Tax=unclassified Gilliamella TaxID=2685620 RepID=UPI00080E4FF8|nr:hypothetical protein [Gilliamella apicola]OCG35372.1 hypothetical protein A9G32_07160 [Gilliamella apicola]OCG50053.1 hypothetical protein A9G27_00140 [Gilliamella apicola]OCG51683.1 hypothetical protein A9G26_04175 [Gilliamella apicola]
MAGIFYFGKEVECVGYNSTFMSVIGEYVRPYIMQLGNNIAEKVYFSYDLYDSDLNFSELTQEQYMQCYKQLVKAIEVDLENIEDFYNHYPKELVYKAWFNEIKPAMQRSLLYQP